MSVKFDDTIKAEPWGYHQVVAEGTRFQVKVLMVKPGQRTSLQAHRHREELWVIVRGCATVDLVNFHTTLNEGDTIAVRPEEKHRIANPGKMDLVVVEVQRGSYLGDDDITRYEDDYGRVGEHPHPV